MPVTKQSATNHFKRCKPLLGTYVEVSVLSEKNNNDILIDISECVFSEIQRIENLKAWKTETGGWFIIDQVVGKHEMIDLAVALTNEGKVKGMEVLQYREAYGSGVKHPKWLAQFLGKDHTEHLQLGNQIHNLSGGTLSSRHIMEGVTRLVHTWNQVLRHL